MKLDQEKIGVYIAARRRELGLTQAELGERLEVSAQAVSNWERGESLPDISLLPDLACILRCSTDALLSGGAGSLAYRRLVTVAQMREAFEAIARIGVLLGQDHFVYRTIIEALNTRMNCDIEEAFTEPKLAEIFAQEFLLECIRRGDYADPRDVQKHLCPGTARDHVLDALYQRGIR